MKPLRIAMSSLLLLTAMWRPAPAGNDGATEPSLAPPGPGAQDAILFVRIPNRDNGKPGIHYEPFMYHFGESAHVPGSQIVRLSPPRPDGELTVLTPDFYAAEEPELSSDATRVLFAGRKTREDGWQVWEMNLDGTGARQITRDMGDVCSPCYLPDGRILFSSTRHVAMEPERRRDEYDRDHARLAHRCDPDGSNVEQISFNVSSDSEFIVLRDGRVLMQSWQHHGMRYHTSGASALFTMNPDGTGFLDFFGNHRGGFRWKHREMPDGRIVYIDSIFHHAYGAGWVGMISPGDPDDGNSVVNLTPDVKLYEPDSPGGRYRDPYPWQDGRLMVSWSPPPTWSAYNNPGGPNAQFSLYWFDFEAKKAGAPIYNDPKYQALNAMAVEPRPTPAVIPDHLAEHPGAKTGTLLCLNAYDGQTDKEAFIKPGQIKAVRIIEGFGIHDADPFFRSFPPGIGYSSFGSSSNSISNFEQKRVVGEAPVAEDGSFFVEVPADTPLHWQTLDENGMALQDALTWAWVRPGENRLCVGCHENRSQTPSLSQTPLAALAEAVSLDVPPEQRRTVDFRRDLVPIIESKCVRCHGAESPAAGLDLSDGDKAVFHRVVHYSDGASVINAALFNKAYLNLSAPASSQIGKHIYPGLARRSPLIWRLHGHSVTYDAPVNQCPPDEPLTAEEKALFALWIDLGAQWDNLPGPDELPSYSAKDSQQLAREARAAIPEVFTDAAAAVETRCAECHSPSRALELRMSLEDWKSTVHEMREKRPNWIKPDEVDLIANQLHAITEVDGLVRHWDVSGPYDNRGGAGIRNAYPPEQRIALDETYPGKDGKPVAWKSVDLSHPTGVLDLAATVGSPRESTAYARTSVPSDTDRVVYARISADDMFELFVNGDKVLQRLMPQRLQYDWDLVPITLRRGENEILVKVHNLNGPWQLRLRLTESNRPTSRAAFVPDAQATEE